MTPAETERLIIAYQPIVRKVAHRFRDILEVDDGVSIGNLGLLNAIRKYDPDSGVPFGTVAYNQVKFRIIDEIRSRFGKNRERYQRTVPFEALSLEQYEAATAYDDTAIGAVESRIDVRGLLDSLQCDEREVLEASYYREETIAQIAQRLDVTVHRVTVLRRQALAKLKTKVLAATVA